jgi:hypothetical protein
MSHQGSGASAADVAAQQVEAILSAAEAAAEEIRAAAAQDADELRATGRREAGRELEIARKKAIELGADARREAKLLVEDAKKESTQIREQTRRAVEGRVAQAEAAATQVLDEAKTLSAGLRQLGGTLQSQGERILRDVQGAHKRMQADLRVAPIDGERPQRPTRTRTRGLETTSREQRPEPREQIGERSGSARATAAERAAIEDAAARLGVGERPDAPEADEPLDVEEPRPSRRGRDNPFDDFDVPSWVER